jgi:hypothetical protein
MVGGVGNDAFAFQQHAQIPEAGTSMYGDAAHSNLTALVNDAHVAAGHDAVLGHSVDTSPASAHNADWHFSNFIIF